MNSTLADQLRQARVYDLEQPRYAGMPVYPTHRPGYIYTLYRRHRDNYLPEQHGPRTGSSGIMTMMEHSGTHIDALCHQACDLKMFGEVAVAATESPIGYSQLGIETVPPLLGRGILLDVAGWKGMDRLPAKYSITADEFAACAAAEGVELGAGDVLVVRTGYASLWDNEAEYLRAAGVSKSGSVWAADAAVAAVGIDNMSWDVPEERDPETGATLFGHVYLLPKKGIYIIENLNLEDLARDRCYSFAFIGIPLKFVGATGSPLRPLALA